MYKKIKLFINDNEPSKNIARQLQTKLLNNGLELSDTDYELAIAIGGDGCFLRMVKSCNFNTKIAYIGVHTGTLGFLQEVDKTEIDGLVEYLLTGNYQYDYFDLQSNVINEVNYKALNEVVIRKADLKALTLAIYIDNTFLEEFVGDGLLIATSIGSSAYNLSFGGSIVDHSLSTLQITPIAPLKNKHYHNLMNSIIIPGNKKVTIKTNNDLIITTDGENHQVNNVSEIVSNIPERLTVLSFHNHEFAKKINKKLLNE